MNNTKIPDNFCLAPWLHAMHDTYNVRKLCCITSSHAITNPTSLEDFKNSDYAKNVRRMMMDGKLPKDCSYCDSSNDKQGHVNYYKDYFNVNYKEYYEEALSKTREDGYTTMDTKSFDYRFGNVCNYKCRHCSSRSSSKIEYEEKQHGIERAWKDDDVGEVDIDLRHQTLEKELLEAADAGVLGDIQWIGGEPLFSEAHWRVMTHLSENCDCSDIRLLYITNLSILEFKGKKLIDLIKPFKGTYIHASIESGGIAAEYIRTGLNWETWKENFRTIKNSFTDGDFKICPGITLTAFSLPGLREYLEFLCDEEVHLAGVTMHKPNANNYHLDIDSLGPYKAQWLSEYRALVEEYKTRLTNSGDQKGYCYSQLIAAADILESQPGLDLDNLSDKERNELKRSVAWANKTDSIRPSPHTNDVIKDYPFMQEWWTKLNSL
jgi:hypothetical protein